jgi:hypothetical protein
MAVSGVKGTGIGQVSMPSRADVEQMIRGNREGIGDIAASYLQGLTSGTGERADRFLPVADFAPDPQTRFGQLFDLPGIAESAARGGRFVTGLPVAIGGTIAESLGLPSEAGFESSMPNLINEEMARIQSEISPFQEEVRRQKQASTSTTPGLGSFTTAGGEETRDQVDPRQSQSGQTDIGINDGEEADRAGAQAAQTPEAATEDIIRTSVQDYLTTTGKESKATTTEEYIKEFADATGLDVSGKPDKSTALMTFGLALMQNKAGKGFDVGKMLGSVGEAGEKAMPAFEKAKSEARALRAKAGEYALGRTREDQAKAQQRDNFYIIPKGKLGGPLGVVDAITKGKGEFTRLNSFELNDLDTNEEFNQNFEIVKASDYTDLAKEALKTPEAKDKYLGTSTDVPLYSGSKLELKVQLPDRNVSSDAEAVLLTPVSAAINQINSMEKGMIRGEQTFSKLTGLLQETDISVPSQARSAVVQTLRNFGLDAGGETDPVKQIKVMLTKLKAKNAAEILGESGKTLSDNDRRMVSEIVGDISFTEGDEGLLLEKLGSLYEDIIGTRRSEINEAYRNLESYGVNFNRGKSGQTGTGFTLGDDGIYRRANQK